MFGFILGTVCLFALVATLRHQYGFAWGGGYGGRNFGRFGGPPWAARHGRQRWFLRRIFEQLDTTPGQEKVIVKHVDSWMENVATGRRELTDVRRQVAQALRGEALDEASLQAALEKVDDLLAKSKLELTQALTEIHASLDPEQRRDLADLLSYGPRHHHGRHRGDF
ncbi:MAG TPA: periplasmic heavy metal sensor [Polyangiales bacterium]|nr:periplasmic heavy metal sensor [Polyangiales bacterium]